MFYNKEKFFFWYIIPVIVLVSISIIITLCLSFLDNNIMLFSTKDGLTNIAISIFNALLWSLVLFWIVKWFNQKHTEKVDKIITNIDTITSKINELLYQEKDNLLDFQNKINLFDINWSYENYKTGEFDKMRKEIIDEKAEKYFLYNTITPLYFELINYCQLNKKTILENEELKKYVWNKVLTIWNIDFYYFMFLELNLKFNQAVDKDYRTQKIKRLMWEYINFKKDFI